MTMPARRVRRRADPDPDPVIDFGVPFMFDIRTELHLRRAGRDAAAHGTGRAARAILIAASLTALALLAAALF